MKLEKFFHALQMGLLIISLIIPAVYATWALVPSIISRTFPYGIAWQILPKAVLVPFFQTMITVFGIFLGFEIPGGVLALQFTQNVKQELVRLLLKYAHQSNAVKKATKKVDSEREKAVWGILVVFCITFYGIIISTIFLLNPSYFNESFFAASLIALVIMVGSGVILTLEHLYILSGVVVWPPAPPTES